MAPPPGDDGTDARAAATVAAGRLLEALAPGLPRPPDHRQRPRAGRARSRTSWRSRWPGRSPSGRAGRSAPDDARRVAGEAGIRLTLHAGTDDPAVEQSFSFDADRRGRAPRPAWPAPAPTPASSRSTATRSDGALHGDLLITRHRDAPGVIGKVGTVLGRHGSNIAGMQVGRHRQGGEALMVLNVDDAIPPAAEAEIRAIEGLTAVYVVSLPR